MSDQKTTHPSREPFELIIQENGLYNRVWLMQSIPGMHKDRLIELQSRFGLLPLNSGNRSAFYLYRGKTILESLEREAVSRFNGS